MGFLKDIRQLADNISYGWTINVPRRGETMKPNIIVNKLDVRPIQRQTQDISKWRNALIYAESPTQQRGLIYDLYADTLLDTHLEAIIEKRIAAITNCKITFTIDGKPVDDVVNLTRKRFFKTFLKEAMNAKMYGHSLLQLDWSRDPKRKSETYLIPRRHVKPRFGIVTVNDYDTEGVNYLDKPFNDGSIIEIGGKEDLGKLLLVAPLVIYKRGNWGDWAEFVECFGMPIIDAAYNNEQSREALQEAFNAMGSRGRLIRPEEAKVEIHTVNDNGTGGNLYNTFRQAVNEEMSISILGNTMTTTEAKNSGYAQSKTHGQSQEQLHQDDREFVLSILNEDVTPYLGKIGFPTEGGVWAFVDAESITLAERLAIDMQVSTKVPVPVSYWYEKYNIPTPQNGEDVTDGNDEDDAPNDPEKDPNTEGSKNADKGNQKKKPVK